MPKRSAAEILETFEQSKYPPGVYVSEQKIAELPDGAWYLLMTEIINDDSSDEIRAFATQSREAAQAMVYPNRLYLKTTCCSHLWPDPREAEKFIAGTGDYSNRIEVPLRELSEFTTKNRCVTYFFTSDLNDRLRVCQTEYWDD